MTSITGRKKLPKLKELASRAGRWLGLTAPPSLHTQAIEADRFDQQERTDTFEQATALTTLSQDLSQHHNYAADLLADVWTAAYKTVPRVRAAAEMDPSRTVNHHVVANLMDTPEFTELHAETAGDPYAAAMAVISQKDRLTRLLTETEQAQAAAEQAAQTRQTAADAAQQVTTALQRAEQHADPDGNVSDDAVSAVQAAISAAEAAEQAAQDASDQAQSIATRAMPAMRTVLRAAAADAAQQVRQEREMMAAWGVGPGQLRRMDFNSRAALARRLASTRISAFADLIGRFRTMAAGQRAQRIHNAPGELVGLTVGDDIGRLIPAELANLGVPALQGVFAARLAEQQLMLYDNRGEQPAGKGAIIACVDCSWSMAQEQESGATGEAWAKACALALLDQARAGNRDFVGILFSSRDELAVFHFPAGKDPTTEDVIDFAEQFLGGGTDYATPLDAAADILEDAHGNGGIQHGDIVLITDGECQVTEEWQYRWKARKKRLKYRLFGVAVAHSPGTVLQELSDTVHTVADLTDPGAVRDIFNVV